MADKLFSELSKGTYSGVTAYTVGDFVDYNGSSYACIANTTGNLPTDTDFWALLASKGDTGDTGAKGDTGDTGATGAAGDDAYVYIAYASDDSGTGFTTTFNASLDYIAIKTTTTEIVTPEASDFTGLWKNYKGATGDTGEQGSTGDTGAAGADAYVYIAYASNDSGADFTTTFNASLNYIAVKTTTTEIVTPEASDFTGLWFNYKGATGEQGEQGIQGEKGLNWQGDWSAGTYQIDDAVAHNGSSWVATAVTTEEPSLSATDWDLLALKGTDGSGSGDVSSNTATSVDSEVALFSGTTGKEIKRATGTGVAKLTSGVLSASAVDLTSEVTDRLPFANLATGTARSVVGRAGSGNGDVGNISAGNDTILSRSGSGDVAFNNASTTRTILGLATTDNPQFATIELGHATDTTIARVAGGRVSVEGVELVRGAGTVTDSHIPLFDGTSGALLKTSSKVVPTGDIVGTTDTQTQTNKRITKRVTSEASSGTPTINSDNTDVHRITALAENITSFTTNLSGTPDLWDMMAIEIIGTATRTIAWGASFSDGGITNLPLTTDSTTPLKVLVQWNGSTWSCLAVS